MFQFEEQRMTLKQQGSEVGRGFMAGMLAVPTGWSLFLIPFILLAYDISLVRGVWIAHTSSISSLGAVARMISFPIPYAMLLWLLRTLKTMHAAEQVSAEAYARLRASVVLLVMSAYFCFPAL